MASRFVSVELETRYTHFVARGQTTETRRNNRNGRETLVVGHWSMFRIQRAVLLCVCLCLSHSLALAEDLVEFLNGSKVRGAVKEIRKEKREFDVQVVINGRDFLRTYQFNKVHAVTMNGKRFILTKRTTATTSTGRPKTRSRREIDRIISEQGAQEPEWLSSTTLNYPETLDLAWPLKAPKGKWNNRRNMGQYLWDIIYPNPGRWRGAIKLMYHCQELHKNDSARLQRDMRDLGSMYFRLFQDYPRAAYWFRRSRPSKGSGSSIMLAECYWRLGSKPMALEMLKHNKLPLSAVKLFGDMGQMQQVLKWTDVYVRAGRSMEAYITAGDAMRTAGKPTQAVQYYKKVLAANDARNKQYDARYRARAKESIEAIQLFEQTEIGDVRDGTYQASTTGYNGALAVEVQVASGRITSVKVTKHREKQFYSAITDTTKQIVERQSVRRIDATSRATITSQAIVNATAKALASGAK